MVCSTIQCGLLFRMSLWLPGCSQILLIVKTSCCVMPAGAAELSASHGAGSKGTVLAGLLALSGIRRAQQRAACLWWDTIQDGNMLCVPLVELNMRAGVHLLGYICISGAECKGPPAAWAAVFYRNCAACAVRVLPAGPVHQLEHEGTGEDLQEQPPRLSQVQSTVQSAALLSPILSCTGSRLLRCVSSWGLAAGQLQCCTKGGCMGCFKAEVQPAPQRHLAAVAQMADSMVCSR